MASQGPPPPEDTSALLEYWRREAEKQKQRADQAETDLDRARAVQAPTAYKQYLENVNELILPTLIVETDPTKVATGSVTDPRGKYYPLELYLWDGFEEKQSTALNELLELFSDQKLFPSKNAVLYTQQTLSPGSRKDELDIRPFIRAAIETPAQNIVKIYLKLKEDSDVFRFQNNARSLHDKSNPVDERESSPPNKRISPERKYRQPVPDRWGIRESPESVASRVCIGEYKAAHKIKPAEFAEVLSDAPADLFIQVLKRKNNSKSSTEGGAAELVATVLCQAYHYMITSGLLYGYITSGRILIFLKVKKSSPQRLFFYWSQKVTQQPPDSFEVRHSPAAQLANFVIFSALSKKEMPRDWINSAMDCGICQWPLLPPNITQLQKLSLNPKNEDDGETSDSDNDKPDSSEDSGDAYVDPREARSRKKQEKQVEQGERRRSPRKRNTSERSTLPTLPYCTQACLLSLTQNLPLDQHCPNAALHQHDSASETHPITKDDLCSLLKDQLAHSLDKDCECLDKYGLYGNTGVLFKITLTLYGYTFVGKGVQFVDEIHLAHEADIYARLSEFQGTEIPVYLGNISLVRPYPLVSLARVTRVMLMSWAGNSIRVHKPEGVDIEVEKYRSLNLLRAAGVGHDDVRDENLVWNEERQRVMVIDFERTYFIPIRKKKRKAAAMDDGKAEAEKPRRRDGKENIEEYADAKN